MDNVSKGLALARLGIKNFPCDRETRAPKISTQQGGRGFYDATLDAELIATWYTLDYQDEDTVVGVWAGGSNLLTADIDRKNGKDGFASIEAAGHAGDLGDTYSYPSASGGEHRIFATDRDDLAPGADLLGKNSGFDIRAGGSYFIWWGDEVPADRTAFSADIPEWMLKLATDKAEFTGEGFSGTVKEWLESISDEMLPSSRVRDLMERIPAGDFDHNEMRDLAWSVVRLGSERETGVKLALERLRAAWLREPYDTSANRHDFDAALRGGINKGGRIQKPLPTISTLSLQKLLDRAEEVGVREEMLEIEASVSETSTEVEFAKARKRLFKSAAAAGLGAEVTLGLVKNLTAFKNSVVSMESTWFGDGEPEFHDHEELLRADAEAAEELEEENREASLVKLVRTLHDQAEEFSFLTDAERELVATDKSYRWWGDDYLDWVKTRLKHFNRPYHVGAMWAAVSVIAGAWGKVPLQGYKPTDCNLYINVLGESTSGKSEAWGFGTGMIDAFYGENSPLIGDAKKISALALHRALILRDGKPSLVISDEVQGFFEDIKNAHWQGTVLSDMSDYYGGRVQPKNTMNDKEISGKRADTVLTAYFTGIADMTLDAADITMWRSGLFYRYLWAFGQPRKGGDYKIELVTSAASYTTEFDTWASEFRRVQALQEIRWGVGRVVDWEPDAVERMEKFLEYMDKATMPEPLYDNVFVPANGRFYTSMMKCATLIALTEASEKVTLRHVLIALSYAGPWHRSMVLAVHETGKEAFERDVEKCFAWIVRNANRQVGKKPWIQRSAVMRAFRPNEIAERLLRQLTEEGYLIKNGDTYDLVEES